MTESGGGRPTSRAALSTNTLLAFLALGVSGAALGPSLPWLAGHWGVRLDEAGVLFTTLFAGSALTVALSGLVLDRWGRKPFLVAGLLLMAAGLVGLSVAPLLSVAAVCTLVLGFGWGCLDVTLNVFVADLYPAARGAALNLMNGSFGFGALVAPLAVGAALTGAGTPQGVLRGLSGVAFLSALLFAAFRFPPRPAVVGAHSGRGALRLVLRERYVLTTILLFFLYVGLEIGFGGWAYSFATAGAHLDAGAAALVVAVYWTAFTLARVGAGLLARSMSGAGLILGGALLIALGATAIALGPGLPLVLFGGAALVGCGCAPIFPTGFGLATERYPALAGSVSSVIVLGGSLGGAVLPYVQGRLLVAGGVPAAAGFMAGVAVIVAGLQVSLSAMSRHGAGPLPSPSRALE